MTEQIELSNLPIRFPLHNMLGKWDELEEDDLQ